MGRRGYLPGQNSDSSNCNWKGDEAGLNSIHRYVERRLLQPCICPQCNQNKKLDLHNLDKRYSRDLSTWTWLCRKCHQDIEGITDKLKSGIFSKGHTVSESHKVKIRRGVRRAYYSKNRWAWPSIKSHKHPHHYDIIKFLENWGVGTGRVRLNRWAWPSIKSHKHPHHYDIIKFLENWGVGTGLVRLNRDHQKPFKVKVRVCIKVKVRVCREDHKGISTARLFRIGLQAAMENPGLISFIKVQRKETVSTSIDITQAEYLYMQWLGLRARETIQIGINSINYLQELSPGQAQS